jgi:REP element-mobilizing transposase RayT
MKTRARQLNLDLRAIPRWGGRRPGAGRKPVPLRRNPHQRRAALCARHPCHATLRVRADVPSLRTWRLVLELERSFRRACARERFRLVHYSIQTNHVHLIVEAASAADLASGMKSIGSRLARAVNRVFHRTGCVLEDRYHLHVLKTPREVRSAIAYVLLNARRHAAKLGRSLARTGRIDPASSGRWFDGRRSLASGRRGCDRPAVSAARTWLLSVGWRNAGLIDPREVPGPRRVRGTVASPSCERRSRTD